MTIEQRVRDRIWALYQESHSLAVPNQYGQLADDARRAQCVGWITSAQNLVHIVCPSGESAYRRKADLIAGKDWGYLIHEAVAAFAAVLLNLLRDADAGALASIADQARAETFDDFLDHAKSYLGSNRKNEAGAIAGIVFEDSLRRVCRKLDFTRFNRHLLGSKLKRRTSHEESKVSSRIQG